MSGLKVWLTWIDDCLMAGYAEGVAGTNETKIFAVLF